MLLKSLCETADIGSTSTTIQQLNINYKVNNNNTSNEKSHNVKSFDERIANLNQHINNMQQIISEYKEHQVYNYYMQLYLLIMCKFQYIYIWYI